LDLKIASSSRDLNTKDPRPSSFSGSLPTGTNTTHSAQEHAPGASDRWGSRQLGAWVKRKTERGDRGDRREVPTGTGDEGEQTDFGKVGGRLTDEQ
jgi:hypothetical protein